MSVDEDLTEEEKGYREILRKSSDELKKSISTDSKEKAAMARQELARRMLPTWIRLAIWGIVLTIFVIFLSALTLL